MTPSSEDPPARGRTRRAASFALAGLLAALSVWMGAPLRAEEPEDGYILALAWGPDYCLQSPHAEECAVPRGFFVQGLWPVFGSAQVRRCSNAKVSEPVFKQLLPMMPGRALIVHEWTTQGSCTGMTAEAYVDKIATAMRAVQIPKALVAPVHSLSTTSSVIYASFYTFNPRMPDGGLRLRCTGNGELSEVRICITSDAALGVCPAHEDDNCGSSVSLRAPHY